MLSEDIWTSERFLKNLWRLLIIFMVTRTVHFWRRQDTDRGGCLTVPPDSRKKAIALKSLAPEKMWGISQWPGLTGCKKLTYNKAMKFAGKGTITAMKRFNLTGVCIPDRHYMVDLSDKIDKITKDYIDQGAYFTINRARQFGKTTLLSALQRRLSDRYLVIRLSFEGIDDGNFRDNLSFVNMFCRNIAKRLTGISADPHLLEEWRSITSDMLAVKKAFDILGDRITALCTSSEKKVLLLIDEVDRCSDNQVFLNFLGMLRSKYLDMQEQLDQSFYSVILASVYDVRNLKLKIRPNEDERYNSPWNIAVDFQVDMSFSTDEITAMLATYSADTGAEMDLQEISKRIYFYTEGYPFLVSWICKWIDENGRNWTREGVDQAEKELLKSDNTLFDDIIKNIENDRELYKIVAGILLDGLRMPFVKSDPVIHLGAMFGILRERDGAAAIGNLVFETFLYNHIVAGKIRGQYIFKVENNQFVANGRLDMERVLQKFQEIMKAEYRDQNETFIESQGRLLFLCFIKPIINGSGNYYVEPETRSHTRMDVVISYGGREHIVELKIWHGSQYRQKGLDQLEEYLESCNCQKGYLISFNFNKNKKYIQNMVVLEKSKKQVYEIVV